MLSGNRPGSTGGSTGTGQLWTGSFFCVVLACCAYESVRSRVALYQRRGYQRRSFQYLYWGLARHTHSKLMTYLLEFRYPFSTEQKRPLFPKLPATRTNATLGALRELATFVPMTSRLPAVGLPKAHPSNYWRRAIKLSVRTKAHYSNTSSIGCE